MDDGRQYIQWTPRVPKWKLRKLYQTDALGIYDQELIDDVGITLYMRCRDILTIQRAQSDRQVRCPRCDRERREVFIERHGGREELLVCPTCGWQITWGAYRKSYHRRQLNPGGAVPAFEAFVRDYEQARTPRDKMLAIDRVIHAFHYSLRDQPDLPTRPAGVNLISGRLTDVVIFLNELSGLESAPEIKENFHAWERTYHQMPWFATPSKRDQEDGEASADREVMT